MSAIPPVALNRSDLTRVSAGILTLLDPAALSTGQSARAQV